MQSLECEPE
jgi:hypothetical protein